MLPPLWWLWACNGHTSAYNGLDTHDLGCPRVRVRWREVSNTIGGCMFTKGSGRVASSGTNVFR
eukprot:2773119-Pyramimonas_sp.AAC.2